ncbi:unnamed protein product [Pleuronectes platessa]|uniref:Uncharacterized protein n=1 Tax=Pleuronectes platessa TaxID=8262 RepID=A0A9N7TKJ2_PLEPL|nr:unnamed protein product [Pleuronectes platessa]
MTVFTIVCSMSHPLTPRRRRYDLDCCQPPGGGEDTLASLFGDLSCRPSLFTDSNSHNGTRRPTSMTGRIGALNLRGRLHVRRHPDAQIHTTPFCL